MKYLRRLAAWLLQKDVKGFETSAPTPCDPFNEIGGWVYGKDWFIRFGKKN